MDEVNWDFNAPTHIDFSSKEHENDENIEEIEDYFNHDHEAVGDLSAMEMDADESFNPFNTPKPVENKEDEKPVTPIQETDSGSSSNQYGAHHSMSALGLDESFNPFSTPAPTTNNKPAEEEYSTEEESINNVTVLEQSKHDGDKQAGTEETSTEEVITRRLTFNTPQRQKIVLNTPHSSRKQIIIDLPRITSMGATSDDESKQDEADTTPPQDTTTAGQSEAVTDHPKPTKESQPDEKKPVLRNLMTPSRLAKWGSSATNTTTTRLTRATTRSDEKLLKKLGRKKKIDEHRQNLKTKHKLPTTLPDPPMKKAKLNTAKANPIIHKPKIQPKGHKRSGTAGSTVSDRLYPSSGPRTRKNTAEQRDAEQMAKLREQAQKMKEASQKSFQQNKRGMSPVKNIKPKPVTRPKEFHFATDQRLKSHTMSTRQDNTADFPHQLRQNTRPASPIRMRRTVPKPFNFSSGNKRTYDQANQDAQTKPAVFQPSMGEAVIDFQKQMRKPVTRPEGSKGPMKALRMTHPKTPNLSTRTRTRSTHIMSQKEIEEKELEEIQKYKFKPTPCPEAILKNPSKLKTVTKKEATVPQSPSFAMKARAANRPARPPTPEPPKPASRPVPHFGVTFKPKLDGKKTVPMPFSFQPKDEERFAKKEERIQDEIKKQCEPANFKAQPCPFPESPSVALPEKKVKEPTKPIPFHLVGEQKAKEHEENLQQTIANESAELKEGASFRANTSYKKILHSEPFKPNLTHSHTEVKDFKLKSELRAQQRDELHQKREQVELEHSRMKQMQEEENKRREEAEVKALRKEMEFHANEVRKFNGLVVRPSDKPLTEARAPNFSNRFKK